MTFYKKLWKIAAVLFVMFVVASMILIIRVNRNFPAAVEVSNDENGVVSWSGCEYQALDHEILTIQDFNKKYENCQVYRYLEEQGKDLSGYGVVVLQLKARNVSEITISSQAGFTSVTEAFPCTWSNGGPIISGKSRLEPDEESEITIAALYAPSLIQKKFISHMEDNTFQVVFSYYPEKVVLKWN